MKRTLALLTVFLTTLFLLSAAKAPRAEPDGQKALAHVQVLASDEMKGRRAGTPEYEKAAAYVAAKMKEYGLQPGGDKGSYFQQVPFKTWTNFEPPTRLEIVSPQGRVYFAGRGRDFQPVSGTGSGIVRAQPVFAGYGVTADKIGWDDYKDLDVKGKFVLVMPDGPQALEEPARKDWTLLKKLKLAAEKGAAGLIEIDLSDPQHPSPDLRRRFAQLTPGACPAGFIVLRAGRNFLDDLCYIGHKSWRDAVSKTLRLGKPFQVTLDGAIIEAEVHFVAGQRTASNVLGILPGADSRLKKEAVIIGGHLDHLGLGTDGFTYNGADDDAGSAAVLLETARVLSARRFKPRRTIIFASWAGEEQGLVGSRYYTEHPLLSLDRTAAYLNIDMVGVGSPNLFVGGMYEYGRFFDILKQGLSGDLRQKLHDRRSYRGSDHTSFWNRGVTAVSLRTGGLETEALDDEHPEYHRPGDRPELINPELLRLAVEYHLEALMNIADSRNNLLDKGYRQEFIHKDADVADLHCDTIDRYLHGEDLRQDLPKGHIDIPKLKRGAVDLQVFACYNGAPENEQEKDRNVRAVFRMIDGVRRLAEENPNDLAVIRSYEDYQKLRGTSKVGLLIGIEGGYTLTDDLSLLRAYYDCGARLLTLTHWTHTDWADASGDPRPVFGGLTEFGEKVVREMNKLGMIIDLSHASDETFWDVLKITNAPVVASHSCCRALAEHHRNLTDDMLKALAKNGGMVGINYSAGFLNSERDKKQTALLEEVAHKYGLPTDFREIMRLAPEKRAPALKEFHDRWEEMKKSGKVPPVNVKTLVDHIDHVVKVTGNANHVGLGSDFDGISEAPEGLENAGKLENITHELLARGYKEDDIRKILGGNFLRILNAVCSESRKAAAK
jgi:membrane dipeptidase